MMAEMVKDPVCGMEIDPATAAGSSEYEGATYYFCAEACKTAFDAEPSKYVGAAAAPEPMATAPAAAAPMGEMPAAPKPAKRWWEFWK
jgi:Cu+-exporting ATPase